MASNREEKVTWPFYVRRFLNKPKFQTGAHIIAAIEKETTRYTDRETGERKSNTYYHYTLRISDCDRVVSFDISDHTPAERANTLAKLDNIVDVVSRFREALAKTFDQVEDH